MAIPSYLSSDLNKNTNTFGEWFERTRQLSSDMGSKALTAELTSSGGVTTGNSSVIGIFSANTIAMTTLRGGSVTASANLSITSNTSFTGSSITFTPSTFSVTSNTAVLSSNTITSTSVTTAFTASDTFTATADTINIIGNTAFDSDVVTIDGVSQTLTASNTFSVDSNSFSATGSGASSSFSIEYDTVSANSETFTISSNTVNISGSMNVSSNAVFSGTSLTVNSDTIINGEFTLGSDLSVSGNTVLENFTANTGVVSVLRATNGLVMPVGNTATRDSSAEGSFLYNEDLDEFEAYIGGSWQPLITSIFDYFANTNTYSLSSNMEITGTVAATDFNATSDLKFKKDIETIIDPLETVKELRGVTFTWKETDRKSMGFIAQEVEQVEPILVETNKDGDKSVYYQNMIALLVESVKELDKRVKQLENGI